MVENSLSTTLRLMSECKVSVIVSCYNIGDFIGQCVRSLMSQTLTGVEYIIVDDNSTDGSYETIKGMVSDAPGFNVVRHERNLGLPATRNTGLKLASGDYIVFCDGDDYMEPTMLEGLYQCAIANDADMVWCDWYLSFSGSERYMKQPSYHTGREAMTGMLHGSMKYNVWNKMCRRSLYDGLSFPVERSMGEDMTMIKVASKANITAHCTHALYHYRRTNTEALTQNYSCKKLEELRENSLDVVNFLEANKVVSDTDIKRFMLNVKLPFLFTGKTEDIRRWREWFPEADSEILGIKDQSLRVRLLQWCASKGLDCVNILYYYLVQRVIYGKIYR